MNSRYITLEKLDEVIAEKMEVYKDWLARGIVSESEHAQIMLTMESVKGWAFMKSSPIELLEKEAG